MRYFNPSNILKSVLKNFPKRLYLAERLTIGLLKFFAILPYGLVARIGNALGALLYQLPTQRKYIVHRNIDLCFPDWSEAQRQQIAKQHFKHAIRSYIERSVQWFGSAKKMEKLTQVESAIDLADLNSPPTIFLGFHFVGIEAGSLLLNYSLKRRCGSLYQPMSNPKIDQVAKEARSRFNAEMVSRSASARAVLRMLRNSMPVMLAADMDYGISNSVFVPFFGVNACTLASVAHLAAISEARVVPFVCEVLPNYRGYKLKIFEPWADYPSDDPVVNARRMNAFLEEQIKLMPEQYYWIHRRFKTRPEGEPSLYQKKPRAGQ